MSVAQTSVVWRNQTVFLKETMYAGRITSAEVSLTRSTIEVGGLGGVGKMQVPTGKFEASQASVSFQSLALSDVSLLVGDDGWIELRLAGDVRTLDSSTGTRVIDAAYSRIKGWCLNPPVPGLNDDGSPYTANISMAYLEIIGSSGTVFKVDWINNIVEPAQNPGNFGATITL